MHMVTFDIYKSGLIILFLLQIGSTLLPNEAKLAATFPDIPKFSIVSVGLNIGTGASGLILEELP